VAPPPPSPIGNQKPPTPQDAADQGDRTLAVAAAPPPVGPAPQSVRFVTSIQPIADGIGIAVPTPARPPGSPGLEERFSLGGNPGAWFGDASDDDTVAARQRRSLRIEARSDEGGVVPDEKKRSARRKSSDGRVDVLTLDALSRSGTGFL